MKNYLPGSSETTSKITEEKKTEKKKKKEGKNRKLKLCLRHWCKRTLQGNIAILQPT